MTFIKNHVGVIGGGSWGTTIANIIGENNYKVIHWLRDQDVVDKINTDHENAKYLPDFKLSENITATTDLSEVAKACRIIFFVVPSKGFREVAYQLGNFINGEHIIIHGTKG